MQVYHHPLVDVKDLKVQLDALCVAQKVASRRLTKHPEYTIYKYRDAPKVDGLARLARGLILDEFGIPINKPIPKFDEIASYHTDSNVYHARVEAALPAVCYAQPKHDGTCIHAVCLDNELIITTFLADDSPQANKARLILGLRRWTVGTTLAFELIDKDDPKVQQKRVADGLYLFYGVSSDGRVLSRKELTDIASELNVFMIKQQSLTNSAVMTCLKRLDSVESINDVQEGLVLIGKVDGMRIKVKSHTYLTISSSTKPTGKWMHKLAKRETSMEAIHEAVENFDGPLDAPLLAHRQLVETLSACRKLLEEVDAVCVDDIEAIKKYPNRDAIPLMFKKRKDADFCQSEDAVLLALVTVTRALL